MWGRMGDYMIQRTRTGKMFIKRYAKPGNPRTPAQQSNRNAMKEAIFRWTQHEKIHQKDYWTAIARGKDFRDGYRAFLSSFMTYYHAKVQELGDPVMALSFVSDPIREISYMESAHRTAQRRKSDELSGKVFEFRGGKEFYGLLRQSVDYLQARGWWNRTRHGLLPLMDAFLEAKIMSLGLLPSPG